MIRTELAPFSEELSEAVYKLLRTFNDLTRRPSEIRKVIPVGVDVRGLEDQPFPRLFRLSPRRIAHETAFVLRNQMGYPKVAYLEKMPEGSDTGNKSKILGTMIQAGISLHVQLSVTEDNGVMKIRARLYDAPTSRMSHNAVEVDLISLSPLEEVNKPFVGTLAAPFVLFLLVVSYPLIRGHGRLVVEETHDPNVERAFFSVLISRKKQPPPLKKGDELSYLETVVAQGRKQSRFQASMVGRHTVFGKLPPRSYFVYFYGVLVDSGMPIGSYSMEKQVRIRRSGRERVRFELIPKEAMVQVQAFLEGEPCYGAEVWVNGNRYDSMYTKDGTNSGTEGVLIRLPKGVHELHVAYEEQLATRIVRIEDMNRVSLFVEVTEAKVSSST